MRDSFSGYHPTINFLFFAFVILTAIFVLHPVLLIISFLCAMGYSIYLNGRKALRFNFGFLLPLMLVAALLNPAFNHEGITILFYLNGNPITLESICYGLVAALMVGTVILWFSCYNAVMTSDKFIYLFGRVIPALSLVISMALRFVPLYKAQIKKIVVAQRCIGRDVSSGKWYRRVQSGVMILSTMISWALENAVETADSMRSRGYGLRGRTAYSNYRFDSRDKALLGILTALLAGLLLAMAGGWVYVRYFPSFTINPPDLFGIPVYIAFAVVCALPLILDIREDAQWRSLKSKI